LLKGRKRGEAGGAVREIFNRKDTKITKAEGTEMRVGFPIWGRGNARTSGKRVSGLVGEGSISSREACKAARRGQECGEAGGAVDDAADWAAGRKCHYAHSTGSGLGGAGVRGLMGGMGRVGLVIQFCRPWRDFAGFERLTQD